MLRLITKSVMNAFLVLASFLVRLTNCHPHPITTPSPEPNKPETSNQFIEIAALLVALATLLVAIYSVQQQSKSERWQSYFNPSPVISQSGPTVLRRTTFASEFYYSSPSETYSQGYRLRPMPTRRGIAAVT
ncbi:hypothetical protein BU24DRAFT_121688 [Aaosphaeria arxii CBS 175.79]|uniref:Uncharacterized protein n=1 Tax=Aaosphaeria arxii CBS 175.79 TaxID=1450172 RepID=A0A6A5Y4U8_9PLEO|nr:uncharacterized protein BU24DRAFT_121688 [Aaosphaeria arxii CBS 175.79]KAF2019544.1 hypothetical protein BU24DRAFT_121688 [Aaosphaeria arxii CBS 175.79]